MEYETVIGLEVHAQLKTRTKAFCGCLTEFGAPANTQACPVCLGFPGSLPVLNEKALEYGMRAALALHCSVQRFSKFDRKNYFYPDLPKNYQISQYGLPLALGGFLEIEIAGAKKRIGIIRAHLEEDAGKLIHEEDNSLIDYNRAGVPLLEIVSAPEIYSPDEAYEYLASLKAILKYLEVCDCDMEKGSLRCDANVSLRKPGAKELGVKAELKNMNSFKSVRDALNYELKRQKEVLESGGSIRQETLLWDEASGKTQAMRSKEEAMDYRYFPEPDLPPFVLSDQEIETIREGLPELPQALKQRFISQYELNSYDAGVLISERPLAEFFEACVGLYPKAKAICNWISGPLSYELNSRNARIESLKLKPEILVRLIKLVDQGVLSNLAAKSLLTEMLNSGRPADELIKEKDLAQVSDTKALDELLDKVITDNPGSVRDYNSGKANALMFLLGKAMRLSKGKANPKIMQEILRRRLDNA
jgi:aspartyl-tRNA(Asn)/glutamyl-tRNA(Gln) amidotransferase subunit B